jgi:peptidoglycan/xylan/chitin deacetylase (PgdA/CDA1 family)
VNVPCPIHGDRRAHKSCHFCRKPICRLCEVRMRGHIYCSTRCARDAGRHAVWRRVREQLVRPVPARLAVLAVALAAGAPMLLALRTVATLDRLDHLPLATPPRPAIAPARIDAVTETAQGARLEGSAPEGAAVFLFAAGRFVSATSVSEGRFRFEGVREKGPYRVGAIPLSAETLAPATAAAAPSAAAAPEAPPAPAAFSPVPAPSARARGPAPPDMTRGPADRPDILVSFDAGSSERGAALILDALATRGIRTTIFLTGDFIRRYPEIVRRIARDGHEVGNHTDTHPHLTTYAEDGRQMTRAGVDRRFLAGQLARTARLYREITGRAMAPLWRAPYGEQNAEIRRWAAEQGYWHVGWTGGRGGLDGLDWVTDPRSPAYQPAPRLVARLVDHAENGGIILLHLGSDREEPVAASVGRLLDGLRARGFRFARASDFLEREGYDAARLAEFRPREADGLR